MVVLNYYLMLDLEFDPAVDDDKLIRQRIDDKKKEWSKGSTNAALKHYKNYLDALDDMNARMLGQDNERQIIAQEAKKLVDEPLERSIKTFQITHGEFNQRIISTIAKQASRELDKSDIHYKIKEAYVEKIIREKGIAVNDDGSSSNQNIDVDAILKKYFDKPDGTDKFKKAPNLYNSLGKLLNSRYSNTKLPCKEYLNAINQRKSQDEYKNSHDANHSDEEKIYALCENVFKNDDTKANYDNFLIWQEKDTILRNAVDDIKNGIMNNKLYLERTNELSQMGRLNPKDASDLLEAYCIKQNAKFTPSDDTKSSLNTFKTCRNCGAITDTSKGVKICSKCGMNLFLVCPECGADLSDSADINFCEGKNGQCRYDIRNIDKARALYDSAKKDIERLDYDSAERCIKEADNYWKNNIESDIVKDLLKNSRNKFGKNVNEIISAISEKRFFAAQKAYLSLQKLIPEYSDPELKKQINNAISESNNYYQKAQSLSSEKDILDLCSIAVEICSDNENLNKISSKYPPKPPKNLRTKTDDNSKKIYLEWDKSPSEGTIYYIVVRKKDTVPLNVDDGERLDRVGMCGYTDDKIEPGVCYYYGIFTERAGNTSGSLTNENSPVYCLTEPASFKGNPESNAVNLRWSRPPAGASVELFRSSSGSPEVSINGINIEGYRDSGLENDREYTYRLRYTYNIFGSKKSTAGITIKVTPVSPPEPIEEFNVENVKEDQFALTWKNPNHDTVTFYSSSEEPSYDFGEAVSKSELEQVMSVLSIRNNPQTGDIFSGTFTYSDEKILYIIPVIFKSGTGIIGKIGRARKGGNITIKDIREVNGKITIWINPQEPPEGLTKYIILSRPDRFVKDLSERDAERKTVLIKQYLMNKTLILDAPENRDYYFTLFGEFKSKSGDIVDYSNGSEFLFRNGTKEKITYKISVSKKWSGERTLNLTFSSDNKTFHLPEIDICTSTGFIPMFKEKSNLIEKITETDVNGTFSINISLPRNTPKKTFVKAFLHDSSLSNSYELLIDKTSSPEIT